MPGPAPRPALRRPAAGRWVGGVATGLAEHLNLDVRLVRAFFAATAVLGGVGAALYVFWWVTIPAPSQSSAPDPWQRLARKLNTGEQNAGDPDPKVKGVGRRSLRLGDVVVALGLLGVAALLCASRMGELRTQGWVVPSLLLVAGAALAWSQLDARRSGRSSETPRVGVARLVGGIVIAATAIVLLVAQQTEPRVVLQSALAAFAVLAGVGLVLAPWFLRLMRELGDERVARERESERADIAAHLHDSVLQTLSLIRSRSTDPEVVRLARSQERDLRSWLYEDRPAPATSVAAQVRDVVAEIEDTRVHADGTAPEIEAVVVGDAQPDEGTTALLAATREAVLNAVAHGLPPISLYLEASSSGVEVFVRDHGEGFDPGEIPSDRFGVRESIIGRVRRRGGQAEITRIPDGGTEVRLFVPAASVEGEV